MIVIFALIVKINQIKFALNAKKLIKIAKDVNKILINDSVFNVINYHIIDQFLLNKILVFLIVELVKFNIFINKDILKI